MTKRLILVMTLVVVVIGLGAIGCGGKGRFYLTPIERQLMIYGAANLVVQNEECELGDPNACRWNSNRAAEFGRQIVNILTNADPNDPNSGGQ